MRSADELGPTTPVRPRSHRSLRRALARTVPLALVVGGLSVVAGPGAVSATAAAPSPTPSSSPAPSSTPAPSLARTPSAAPRASVPTPSATHATSVAPGASAASTAPSVTPTRGATPTPAPTLTAAKAAAEGSPALTVALTAAPTTTSRTGQQITYSVVVTNSGDQVLTNTVVAAPARGTSAPVCAPVPEGATLAVGASTTCTETRTTDQAYLASFGDELTARATAVSPTGTTVTSAAKLRTRTSSLAPQVTDDTVAVVYGTPEVLLPASTNDSPGEVGGAAIDPTRTRFPDSYGSPGAGGGTSDLSFHGQWRALQDGRVLFLATGGGLSPSGFTDSVRYQTVDVTGHSTTGRLTVVYRPGPRAADDAATTTQGDPVTVHPLANDTAGNVAQGAKGTLLTSSLRFTPDQPLQPYAVGDAVVSGDGTSMRIPWRGTFTVVGDTIRYQPSPGFANAVQVIYSVTDSIGSTLRATVTFNVANSLPAMTDDSAVTTSGRAVTLPGPSNDTAGTPGHLLRLAGFLDRSHSLAGTTFTTSQGTWSSDTGLRTVTFTPANGFAGVASTGYAVDEVTSAGVVLGYPDYFARIYDGKSTGTLRVTVRPGPSAPPVVLSTPHDVRRSIDVTGPATPSVHADGSPGRFLPLRTVFTAAGQPAGSQVYDGGKTLVLGTQGKLTVSASTGQIAYTPAPGFVGFAGTVGYRLTDDTPGPDGQGRTVDGRLTVLATGAVPVATDDSGTAGPGTAVRLAGATNDDRGTASTALTVDLPRTDQPAGSTVSSDGKTLTVPDEGTWRVGTDGSVTFTPRAGFLDAASPVTYRVRGTGGGSATARLSVTVLRGVAARSDLVTRSWLGGAVDVTANDLPGLNADGTSGSVVLSSVRFPATGQPAGATVGPSGAGLSVPASGGLPAFTVYAGSGTDAGVVFVTPSERYRGPSPTFRYTVQGLVRDSSGAYVTTTSSPATLRVTGTGRDPVATDDAVTVAAGTTRVEVPAGNDDAPSAAYTSIDEVRLPDDVLGSLPTGSSTGKKCYDPSDPSCLYFGWYVDVPGQGTWSSEGDSSGVQFVPEAGFVGTTTPLRYLSVEGAWGGGGGGQAEASMSVTVLPPGTVRPDQVATPQGVPITVDLLANDTPGRAPDGTAVPLAPTGARFESEGQPKGSTLVDGVLVVPGQGRYRIEPGTATVTFTPEPGYRGWASPVLVHLTSDPVIPSEGATTRLQVHLDHVDPTAEPDTATTTSTTPVRIPVLDDDAPGTPARPLVASSLRLRTTAGLPAGSAVSSDGHLLTVAGRGTFAVAGDGTLTFYPEAGSSGTLPPVRYDVADVNGTRAGSTVTVGVTR